MKVTNNMIIGAFKKEIKDKIGFAPNNKDIKIENRTHENGYAMITVGNKNYYYRVSVEIKLEEISEAMFKVDA